jgi:protein SCO1
MSESKTKSYSLTKGTILVLIILVPATIYYIMTLGKHNMLSLPFYGEREAVTVIVNGKEKTDTIYHTVPDFSFTNHHGEIITRADFDDNIYVANFFFTTCPTICPKMSAGMLHAQEKLKDFQQVKFLSHTVDPERDTVEALAAYAKQVHAGERWHFVTGDKREIYEIAVRGYLVPVEEDVLAPGGFLHSEQFILIDKKGRIRGFYDGTSITEINSLIDGVKVLIAEEHIPRKSKKTNEHNSQH